MQAEHPSPWNDCYDYTQCTLSPPLMTPNLYYLDPQKNRHLRGGQLHMLSFCIAC